MALAVAPGFQQLDVAAAALSVGERSADFEWFDDERDEHATDG
jgi:hypothetical protein